MYNCIIYIVVKFDFAAKNSYHYKFFPKSKRSLEKLLTWVSLCISVQQ